MILIKTYEEDYENDDDLIVMMITAWTECKLTLHIKQQRRTKSLPNTEHNFCYFQFLKKYKLQNFFPKDQNYQKI